MALKLFKRDVFDIMKEIQSELDELGVWGKTTYWFSKAVDGGLMEVNFVYAHSHDYHYHDHHYYGHIVFNFRDFRNEDDDNLDDERIFFTGSGVDGFKRGIETFLKIKSVLSQLDEFMPLSEFLTELQKRGIELET